MTAILAFWSRVEYRSKQLAPYILLRQKPSSLDKAVLLDYISPIVPATIISATRNRDALVALASISSLLATLLLVVSTGLLGLMTVNVDTSNVPMTASDAFISHNVSLPYDTQMAFYIFDAVHNLTLQYPPGTTSSFAYQSFSDDSASEAGTLSAEIDGFFADLTCEAAVLHFGGLSSSISGVGAPYSTYNPAVVVSNVSISTDNCRVNLTLPMAESIPGKTQPIGVFEKVQCNDLGDGEDARRIAIYTMELMANSSSFEDDSQTTTEFSIPRSTQLLCRPTYSLPRLRATIDRASGTNIAASFAETSQGSSTRMINGVGIWDLVDLILTSMSTITNWDQNSFWSPEFVLARQARLDLTDDDMFEQPNLETLLPSFFTSVSAQIAKEHLMEPSQLAIVGSTSTPRTRLVVRSLSARIMEAVLIVLAIFAIGMATLCRREYLIPCDPGSIAGSAAVLSMDEQLLDHSVQSPVPKDANFSEPSWQPFALKVVPRSLGLVAIACVVITLEVLLQMSQKHDGIANVDLSQYIHYTWLYIPAFVMVLIKLFSLSLDFNARLLAPFARLRRGGTYRNALNVNYLKQLAPAALNSSVRLGQFAVTGTTFMALIGGFLTIIVSGVYDTVQVPTLRSAEVQTQDSFRGVQNISLDVANNDEAGTYAGLILEANLSYPQWTYEELVFPKLEMVHNAEAETLGSSVDTSVPCLRANLVCRYLHGLDQISASINWTDGTLNIVKPNALSGEVNAQSDVYLGGAPTVHPDDSFAWSEWGGDGNGLADPPEFDYIWGSLSGRDIQNIVILMCNENIHTVQVNTRFLLPDFTIDESRPPTPVENSSTWFSDLFLLEPYTGLPVAANSPFPDDEFFSTLVAGKGGVQLSDFSAPSSIDTIVDTIKHFHGIMRAQQYNLVVRQPPPQNASLASRRFAGTVTDNSRNRLVQHAISTRILEGLLLAMLLLGIAATFMMDTRHVLLENPCSISAMARLLADSDLLHDPSSSATTGLGTYSHLNATSSKRTESHRQQFQLGFFEGRKSHAFLGDAAALSTEENSREMRNEKPTKVFTIRAVDPLETGAGSEHHPLEGTDRSTAAMGVYAPVATDDVAAEPTSSDLAQGTDHDHAAMFANSYRSRRPDERDVRTVTEPEVEHLIRT